jgi:DNA-binding transcriptional regulator GbsR (MarR family)
MKMRLTISDKAGAELVSQVFEIGGRNDYQQATSNMWDQLREKLNQEGG